MVVNFPQIARLGIAIKTTLVESHNLILALLICLTKSWKKTNVI